MEEFQTYTLPNGLRLIYRPTQSAVSYCGFTVNAGTRDEDEDYSGLAHFVEHTIFKGTTHRRASHILNRMEVVGGELNAYTSKEETVVYSVFPGAHLARAMQLLGDLVADSQFPERELCKEREVVVDEINSYRDTPSELIYDEFESSLFEGCSLGRNILGDVDSLTRITSDVARRFLTDYYTPENMVFFFMGSTSFNRVRGLAERYFGHLCRPKKELSRELQPFVESFSRTVSRDTHQSHVIIGARAYDLFDKRRRPLLLLNNLLGAGHEQRVECEPSGKERVCLYGGIVCDIVYRYGTFYGLFRDGSSLCSAMYRFGEEGVEEGSRAKAFAGEVGGGQTSVYGADRGFYRSFGECGVGFGKEFPPLRSFRFFGGDCVFDGTDYGRRYFGSR